MILAVPSISSSSGRVLARHLNTGRLCFLPRPFTQYVHHSAASHQEGGQNASAKLFQDAAQEEAEEAKPTSLAPGGNRFSQPAHQSENWTGEESVQDAVLRMLMDKYRPLRTGVIRTADEKLKDTPPQVGSRKIAEPIPTRTWKNEPYLPPVEGHKPWHTTFKAPTHSSASIKLGNIKPLSLSTGDGSAAIDDRTRRTERELTKRREQAGRLACARESTLDYRLGLRGSGGGRSTQVNPVSLKGWQSLVEDRIEVRRLCMPCISY